ncbi:Imm8 family immunity protein [Ectobacillus panaciterrae]|uniref:Imm8 family immunity protein n=1 Tax=Ectobacillus panaciterrae TaxID=363872 RepID=UPI00048E8A8E|nr:Imm8 family immunity protein [Ectobacillus panaciterrae]
MIEIKALTKGYENWGEDIDDFYISYELDIGPSDSKYPSDLFNFDVVSPKRLNRILEHTQIEIGRGYLIMNDFNTHTVTTTVNRLVNTCRGKDLEQSIQMLSQYFRYSG